MKPVFADTSYYVALLGPADARHDLAIDWGDSFLGRTFVTEYVLVELGNSLCGGSDRTLFGPFVEHLIADPSTVFIPASPTLFQQGLTLYADRPDKRWSLVDCISFVVMTKHRIRDALTADRHFEQAGFKALLR